MSKISIKKIGITKLEADAVVNAGNDYEIDIVFTVLDDKILEKGQGILDSYK